jgi:hypothetical protein
VTPRSAQNLGPGDSPTFVQLTLTGLDASKVVVTNASKALASGTNTNAELASAVSLKHTQGTDTTLGTQAEDMDLGGFNIQNMANAENPQDAVTLKDLLDSNNVTLNYWMGAADAFTQTLVESAAFDTETVNSSPQTLSTVFFKTIVAETPTPFTIQAGTIIGIHTRANVDAIASKRRIKLTCQLGYVDADGSSNFTQIGSDSDASVLLEIAVALCEIHIHVPTNTTVPAGKRLWLKYIATTQSGTQDVAVGIEYNSYPNHVTISVAGSVLGRFLLLAGGTMSGAIAMGSNKVTGLAVASVNGDAIRATTKITEVLLESATDLKHAAVTVSAPIALSTQALSLVNNAGAPATVTALDIGALANSDTVVPTSKAVTTALAAKLSITSLKFPFYIATGTLDTIALTADQKLPFYVTGGGASNIPLTT